MTLQSESSTQAAVEAFRRGYTPVPIRDKDKAPFGLWRDLRWDSEEQVRASFDQWARQEASGVGLICGEASSGLVDIDLDHPKAARLRDYFLPPTAMRSGRTGRAMSHYWYIAGGGSEIPASRTYKMPDRSVSVELRADGRQTVIPPTPWWDKTKTLSEERRWEGLPWGGDEGPAVVDGRKLSIQVALLALGSVLLDAWPGEGSRHDAYLALAGGLLRFGEGVHPYWERNLPVLISALADATHDEDGAEGRVAEVMGTTLKRLRDGGEAIGFPKLAEIIGADHAEQARRRARDVEQLGGFTEDHARATLSEMRTDTSPTPDDGYVDGPLVSTLPPEVRNPLEERISSWEAVDLEPYLAGEVLPPEANVLVRSDGQGLFYQGRVNLLYGLSESGKTWTAGIACVQEIGRGDRILYLDFEDEPIGSLSRFRALGVGDDDLLNQFKYVHPEGPLVEMERGKYGPRKTEEGDSNSSVFRSLLDHYDPTLIVVDGMTALYGLHGLDTNDAMSTDVITSWTKSLCRGGRTTVIVIDHTGKGGGAGASPIGAHHKIAMVQGSALRVEAVDRPMPGEIGRIRLIVYKDRPGTVRASSTKGSGEQVAGVVILDSRQKGVTKFSIDPADPKDVVVGGSDEMEEKLDRLSRKAEMQEQVLDLFGGDADRRIRTAEVRETLGFNSNQCADVWAALVARGEVQRFGSTRDTYYILAP